MSRYVDLNGLTWDGTKITSKIQEVSTKHGYMSAITIGWLFGDNVPHIDIEEHDKKVKADAIGKAKDIVKNYHAHIDNDVIECIFRDLEHLKDGNIDIEITDECFGCFHCEYQDECVKQQDDDDFVPFCASFEE